MHHTNRNEVATHLQRRGWQPLSGISLEARNDVRDARRRVGVCSPARRDRSAPTGANDLGLVHAVGSVHGLDVVRAARGGLAVAVQAVPLLGGVPEARGDLGDVDVLKVVFRGGCFLLLT